MVDETGLGGSGRAAQRPIIQLAGRCGQQQRAAAAPSVGAGHAGQQGHRAQRLAAARQPRHSLAEPDERPLRGAIDMRETLDVGLGEARDFGNARGGEAGQHLGFELVEPGRVRRDIVAIDQTVARQDVHDPERQRGIGADADLQMPVSLPRSAALAWIDDDDLDSAPLCSLGLGPEMHVGGDQIGAPGDDQVAVFDRFRVGAADRPDGQVPGFLAARVADRPGDQAACAERMEQTQHQPTVHLALMRAVGIAEQRQGPGLGDNLFPSPGDLVERLVPAYRREASLALWADTAQWRAKRSGECTRSASRLTLAQANPAVNGCSGSPRTRRTLPFSTSASSEHMSGQSCAQTTRTVSINAPAFGFSRLLSPRRHEEHEGTGPRTSGLPPARSSSARAAIDDVGGQDAAPQPNHNLRVLRVFAVSMIGHRSEET